MDDDLPPLCDSDAELSDDLPNLEHSEGEDCDAGDFNQVEIADSSDIFKSKGDALMRWTAHALGVLSTASGLGSSTDSPQRCCL